MIEWRLIKYHPETEVAYYGRGEEIDVIPEGDWLFCWADGSIERISINEDLRPDQWPGFDVCAPTHWAKVNLPEGMK